MSFMVKETANDSLQIEVDKAELKVMLNPMLLRCLRKRALMQAISPSTPATMLDYRPIWRLLWKSATSVSVPRVLTFNPW